MSPRYLQLGNDGERLLGELLSWENAPERITLLGELSWENYSPGRILLGEMLSWENAPGIDLRNVHL